jgi:hypothetical protein
MGQIVDIGRRIELVPMDPHFRDISIGLCCQQRDEGPAFLVYTYSGYDGAAGRIAFVVKAMQILGGMELTPDGLLRFPCGTEHHMACKRLFLEACKLATGAEIEPRPLTILDKKSGLDIKVENRDGVYHVTADGEARNKERRISAIAGGLLKLGEMVEVEGTLDQVTFPCGHAHDALLGLLLVRAPNVRAILRELESATTRGVLAAPSQQN